jgi:hypothetical protein
MSTQALSLPLDITWQRLAYSRDMVDTDFGSIDFPPKWRSSLALYAYLVPEEQTAESYPDGRIMYLKLTCSITGWNPNEELHDEVDLDTEGDQLDDLQTSTWEAIQSAGWAKTYFPCLGAIAQVAIYPGRSDQAVTVDEFPYIVDFEPKKRELLETATDNSESLAGSSNSVSVQKGTTSVDTTEISVSATAGVGLGSSITAGFKNTSQDTTVNNRNTDTSREDRETKSFTTTFSQMYQVFTGYHLGTNRAVFYVLPRPHMPSSTSSVDVNLISGERKLEGIQDMFLVVHLPKSLTGVCMQANLDTAHDVQKDPGHSYIALAIEDPPTQPNGGKEPEIPRPNGGGGGGDGTGAGGEVVRRLVVTRRVVRSCARFEGDGRLVPVPVPEGQPERPSFHPPVSNEEALAETITHAVLQRKGANIQPEERADLVNALNGYQSRVADVMISGYSAGRYRSRRFVETETFRRLAALSMTSVPTRVATLARSGVLTAKLVRRLRRLKINTVGELFSHDIAGLPAADREVLRRARDRVIKAATQVRRSRPGG